MQPNSSLAVSTLITGSVASFVSTAALATLARREGKTAVQPTNATSHWLHGEDAGDVKTLDAAHTGVGYATHHASALFWAIPLEIWLHQKPPSSVADVLGRAAAVSSVAAIVDYGITPKRLTPGWEEVLSKPSMVGAFVALAAGLAGGAIISHLGRRAYDKGDTTERPRRVAGLQN